MELCRPNFGHRLLQIRTQRIQKELFMRWMFDNHLSREDLKALFALNQWNKNNLCIVEWYIGGHWLWFNYFGLHGAQFTFYSQGQNWVKQDEIVLS